MMSTPESIIQVNAPIINVPIESTYAGGIIYSIYLANGMVITSPENFRQIPEDFLQVCGTIQESPVQDKPAADEIIPVDTILPGDPIYKLNFSVDGVIEHTIDGFIITAPIFDEEGYGETYESAWDDLLSSIRDRYASLVKREQGLSPPDLKVLSELRKYLSEVVQ